MSSVVTKPKRDRTPDEEKRMELTEHLGELRNRIIRIGMYIAIGATVCYYKFQLLYGFLFAPMKKAMNGTKLEWRIVFTNFTEAFFVVLQVSFFAGLILVLPLIIGELYGFISPALTKEEKKPLRFVVPMSVVLFGLGVALAYWTATFAIIWFVDYVRLFPNGALYQDPKLYVMFMLKMMGIFGLVFQLPVLLSFLAWVGILTAATMKRTWRHAVLIISVVGLIITPSNDMFTMLMMIIPVIVLYLGSIVLVGFIEKRRKKRMIERERERDLDL
ncbi:MAG: twin-arginine translocase subunit TatC [Chthonomonadales bacterium]